MSACLHPRPSVCPDCGVPTVSLGISRESLVYLLTLAGQSLVGDPVVRREAVAEGWDAVKRIDAAKEGSSEILT